MDYYCTSQSGMGTTGTTHYTYSFFRQSFLAVLRMRLEDGSSVAYFVGMGVGMGHISSQSKLALNT
jgi:hypothetical protein